MAEDKHISVRLDRVLYDRLNNMELGRGGKSKLIRKLLREYLNEYDRHSKREKS